jgi:transposase-like protein
VIGGWRCWLRARYVDDEQSASTIADNLSVPTADVRDALDGFGIVRPPSPQVLSADAIRAAFDAGGSVNSIARTTGVDRTTVRRAMRRAGIVNPQADRGRRPVELDDADWLRRRYVDAGMSMRAIAEEVGAASATVSRALRRHSIKQQPRPVAPRVQLDADWLQRWYEVDRAPVKAIAAEAGVTPEAIVRAVGRLGLQRSSVVMPPRRPHPHADKPGGIDPARLRKQYVDEGLTIAKIAKEVGVSTTTVHRALAAHGIRRR